ncbi:hypothetical protein BMJ27_07520 [Sinorhizobium medicae]|uniref:hypothetical protein n=1 Tax=Sinorhizobium medicae TaxID=110321 RepID=UPI000C7E3F3E|nr:hypothetical protein [Sinorhizobium medicae]PLU38002.1 hypothetical protein BMJ27_07520 [Sinorhizobium medicae]
MKPAVAREIKQIAAEAGALSWALVRESRHLIVDFRFTDCVVRQVLAATPSGPRARQNEAAWLKRRANLGG